MINIPCLGKLKEQDCEVYDVISKEANRLQNSIELIASENVVSSAVMQAAGSVLTNKYAEGYPNARYYGGCVNVDVVEQLAINRLKKLFQLDKYHFECNVQPHSGSQANMAAYLAFLKPGDTILGMDLSAGGHLTHGCKVNFSGKLFSIHSYGTNNEGVLDYEQIKKIAQEVKPKMIVCGASAYPREIDFEKFKEIADSVGAMLMADIAHIAGLVACNLHKNPFEYCDIVTTTTHKTLRGPRGGAIMAKAEHIKKINSAIFPGIQGGPLEHIIAAKAVAFGEALLPEFKTYQEQVKKNAKIMTETLLAKGINLVSNGTDNHLMLLDLRSINLTGKEAEALLEDVGITTNKNGIPNDPQPPKITSGIRIGTPAITTRGFKENDCQKLAEIIAEVLITKKPLSSAKSAVKELCDAHPLYDMK